MADKIAALKKAHMKPAMLRLATPMALQIGIRQGGGRSGVRGEHNVVPHSESSYLSEGLVPHLQESPVAFVLLRLALHFHVFLGFFTFLRIHSQPLYSCIFCRMFLFAWLLVVRSCSCSSPSHSSPVPVPSPVLPSTPHNRDTVFQSHSCTMNFATNIF